MAPLKAAWPVLGSPLCGQGRVGSEQGRSGMSGVEARIRRARGGGGEGVVGAVVGKVQGLSVALMVPFANTTRHSIVLCTTSTAQSERCCRPRCFPGTEKQ